MTVILTTHRLRLRNWTDEDRPLFHEINSDPDVMEFFAVRRDRAESDSMLDTIRDSITTTGLGFYAIALKETDEPIGFCGLWKPRLEPFLPPDAIEIGWRLAKRHWGKGYATEAGAAALRRGFTQFDQSEIVSFAVTDNHRSTAVMRRLGLRHEPERDFDHPRVPDTHPHLKRHVLYAISVQQWNRTTG
ncbi:GNAT family N-acetyltransferase [Rhizobium grahamii]|uniref:GNAT family N-acetyltransferase n=1 Tax=Rhizobium grahamii TaxID=1120045 RepID=A0A5Q0C4Y1_9HYPH|nr:MULTISPECIES: GNAT family N-acetyltransferase [Rhizobium]QFY60552.1 GNAT family N-acetyltransferase [Rhizobium grahamii]QRM50319.1 GNAT family N-acetyltransferase [Rhizobium sp. BG6]